MEASNISKPYVKCYPYVMIQLSCKLSILKPGPISVYKVVVLIFVAEFFILFFDFKVFFNLFI